MERAKEIGLIEENLTRLYIEDACGCSADLGLAGAFKRTAPSSTARLPAVEQVIQRQVGSVLELAGLTVWGRPFPPVQFTFTEPPKKLASAPGADCNRLQPHARAGDRHGPHPGSGSTDQCDRQLAGLHRKISADWARFRQWLWIAPACRGC